ncbi:glycosyltransferase family 2 protein [Candidatus Sumerlaeota bacterium]|nr:glycosyltransferase family 2 protein [Candidatus Sumerlaeota bacterium]
MTPEISIVVANWNGKDFIEDCVSTLWKSGEACGKPFELIVVDDVSTDCSAELVEEKFPQARLLRNPRNLGFAGASNAGAQAAQGRLILMMNNDMKVPEEFVARAVAAFFEERPENAPPLFAVGAKTIDWNDGSPNHLCMDAAWRRGGVGKVWSDPQERCPTVFPQGGSTVYNRELFLRLGGFNTLFHPGYWEDYDLSWRAVKCGWEVLYEPAAAADHLGQASMKRLVAFSKREQLIERNRLFFNWLNLDDPALILRHIAALPWVYGRDLLQGRGVSGMCGFFRAIVRLPEIIAHRRGRRKSDPSRKHNDRYILRPENFGKTKYFECQ